MAPNGNAPVDESGRHVVWQTAWALLAVIAATVGTVYWVAARDAADTTRKLPYWPVYLFVAAVLIGLYMVFAPIMRTWPFWDAQRHFALVRLGRSVGDWAGWPHPQVFAEPTATAPAIATAHDASVRTFSVEAALWKAYTERRDVTARVKSFVKDGRLEFLVVNQELTPGEDIAYGEGKVLYVTYKLDGKEITRPFPESTWVSLPPPKSES